MIIGAIAIDDELPALKVIENFCRQVDFIRLQKTFNKPGEALKYLGKYPVDLLFLDINMPSMLGTEFYRSMLKRPLVIFTTAYSEYAVEGFSLNALDYLLKPYTLERFLQAVHKAQEQLRYQQQKDATETPQHLILRVDYSLTRINMADILFIEGLDDYLRIHLHNQPPVVVRMTMKHILEKLPAQAFIRVHRSYIVPFARIEQVRNKIIQVAGREIPIGSSYEAAFFSLFRQ